MLEVSKGRCNGHLLRCCKELQDVVSAKEQPSLVSLSALLQEALDLARRWEASTPAGYDRRVQELENRLDDWLDSEGNVYLTGKGVTVFDKSGKKVEHIPEPEPWTANVCFGGKDHRTLFITASKGLYSLRMRVKGVGSQ